MLKKGRGSGPLVKEFMEEGKIDMKMTVDKSTQIEHKKYRTLYSLDECSMFNLNLKEKNTRYVYSI